MPAAPSVNYWPDTACARAFWGQHELPCYRALLADTVAWLDPQPGERWLDLGCGSGQLTRALWEKSRGTLAEIIGIDCAAVNRKAFDQLAASLEPTPTQGTLRFLCADFLGGMAFQADATCDGVVSGLAIQYAESYSDEEDCWTCAGYDGVLADVARLLRPGGQFVFSVNVPEPAWGRVAVDSLGGVLRSRRPVRYLQKAWRMWSYGGWLKREARRGRFHYLPLAEIAGKLTSCGFTDIEHRLSYAQQAYLIRCRKPG